MPKHNPYQSPSEADPPPQHQMAGETSPTTRFRWRTVPIALLLGFGGISALSGLLLLCMMTYTTWTGSPLYQLGPVGFDAEGVYVSAFTIFMGSTLVIAAVQWSHGKGWRAVAITVGVIVVCYFARAVGVLPN